MASENIIEFYKTVRNSPEMWRALETAADTDTMISKAVTMSAAQGIILSPDEVRDALAGLPDIIAEAAGDELTDDELELVAAGAAGNNTLATGDNIKRT